MRRRASSSSLSSSSSSSAIASPLSSSSLPHSTSGTKCAKSGLSKKSAGSDDVSKKNSSNSALSSPPSHHLKKPSASSAQFIRLLALRNSLKADNLSLANQLKLKNTFCKTVKAEISELKKEINASKKEEKKASKIIISNPLRESYLRSEPTILISLSTNKTELAIKLATDAFFDLFHLQRGYASRDIMTDQEFRERHRSIRPESVKRFEENRQYMNRSVAEYMSKTGDGVGKGLILPFRRRKARPSDDVSDLQSGAGPSSSVAVVPHSTSAVEDDEEFSAFMIWTIAQAPPCLQMILRIVPV